MSRAVSCLHCDWTGPEPDLAARPVAAGITLDVCPRCGHDTYLYLPLESPPMTTRVRITCAHESHHNVTVNAVALQGGARSSASELRPGEEREFFVHSGQSLVIDEGAPAHPQIGAAS